MIALTIFERIHAWALVWGLPLCVPQGWLSERQSQPACFLACIDEGGTEESCRLECSPDEDEEPCTDGDESIREGILYICVDGEWQEAP